MAIVTAVLAAGTVGGCSSSRHAGAGTTSTSSAAPASTRPASSSTASSSTASTTRAGTTPPTTTAPLGGGPRFPVSATFVSAAHGWTLEGQTSECPTDTCNFRVVTTTDGGTTWRTLTSSVLKLQNQPRIRFADATHGFVFDGTHLYVTDDGGTHWTLLKIPFQTVQTLEIARGVVYVVASVFSPTYEGFRIWSTPADHPSWTQDPLDIPLGAGPVPEQQLVLTHGTGWMINLDRTVLSGARQTSSAHWTQWNPPCLTTAGPAELSASSSRDLVALCDEHVWGGDGPIASAVYFSHDGGTSYRRRAAPAYGLFSSPNPSTAVIVDGRAVWRTTDEGSEWNVVSRPGGAAGDSAVEVGFTTPTQGFLIEGRGGMFMTRDGGASWSRAPLP